MNIQKLREGQINIDWLPSVETYQDLLLLSVDTLKDGDVCMVKNQDMIYTWDAALGLWILPKIDPSQISRVVLNINSDTILEAISSIIKVDTTLSDVIITLPSASNL